MPKSFLSSILLSLMAVLLVSGCASNNDKQKTINLVAEQRASILSAGLPIEYGPLNIMRANAKEGIVEILMIFNADDAPQSSKQLMSHAVDYYCSSKEVKGNMEIGVKYRLMLRNPRGQLLIDQMVTKDTCKA
ncbi:GspS/AspS pilotin family protein [Vibrio tapetis subsp. quintayensis]|uniref:GspS/AspS pilotin family protein n=1 Tax=Vibrio tapetis TaxID=52443 RepID=UPI0025B5CC1C|nr:GspS/AspS pilotin family protein [Vibrio tapetis]MDN3679898.1 GspS/AspS pilotin family protein [Vibrio tapetis subsp. quintayensis]